MDKQCNPQPAMNFIEEESLRKLSEATAQYERYVQLQLVAGFAEPSQTQEQRRPDWTHPIGLVMAV